MDRIYHRWELWEDHKHGFYNNISGNEKEIAITKVLELFNNEHICRDYMFKVVDEWFFSCQHNLTNEAMNKVAYIGQAACSLYYNIPNTVTMEAWSFLSDEVRDRADKIAKEALNHWLNEKDNRQICLNII